jgi:hypothetical protein
MGLHHSMQSTVSILEGTPDGYSCFGLASSISTLESCRQRRQLDSGMAAGQSRAVPHELRSAFKNHLDPVDAGIGSAVG